MTTMTIAEEIRITLLTNNPGILPFKLGNSKFKQQDHTFLHYFNIDELRHNIITLDNQISTLTETAHNPHYNSYSLPLSKYLGEQLQLIKNKYNSISKHRYRRGIINGLGSIIKSITGNLDQDDAETYSRAILTLQSNQKLIANKINNGISLSKPILERYNTTISTIIYNQNSSVVSF